MVLISKLTKASSFIFFVVLISIGNTSLVFADHPVDADGDGVQEGIVHEIIGLLKHPEFGLEAIKDIVKNIEGAVFSPDFGLEAIDDEVEHIETELHDSDYGLDAIDNEVEHLEGAVFDSDFGLEEIDDEVEALQVTFNRIEKDVDDVEEIVNDIEDDLDMAKSDITMIKNIVTSGGTEFKHLVVSGGASVDEIGFNRVCPSGVPACGPVLVDSIVFDPFGGQEGHILTKMCVDNACGPVFTSFNSVCAGVSILVFPIPPTTVDAGDCQQIPLTTGDGENVLLISGVGTLTGGKITIKTSSGYAGNVEFDIWAPKGSTFTTISN